MANRTGAAGHRPTGEELDVIRADDLTGDGGGLTYAQVLEANNAIQTIGDDTYWLWVTRAVQKSKLFPVPPYMLRSYLMCFYRYPALLRKAPGLPRDPISMRA